MNEDELNKWVAKVAWPVDPDTVAAVLCDIFMLAAVGSKNLRVKTEAWHMLEECLIPSTPGIHAVGWRLPVGELCYHPDPTSLSGEAKPYLHLQTPTGPVMVWPSDKINAPTVNRWLGP